MNLYDIDRNIEIAIERLFDSINEETGEVCSGSVAELEALKESRAAKLDNIGAYMKNLKNEIIALETEADMLKARAAVKKNKLQRLNDYVTTSLQNSGDREFETTRAKFSFRKSISVNVDDEKLPKKYFVKKVEYAPDKTAIKEALKNGEKIRGAELIEKQNLQLK